MGVGNYNGMNDLDREIVPYTTSNGAPSPSAWSHKSAWILNYGRYARFGCGSNIFKMGFFKDILSGGKWLQNRYLILFSCGAIEQKKNNSKSVS